MYSSNYTFATTKYAAALNEEVRTDRDVKFS